MITLEKCAFVLNRNGKKYSEEEIKKIREILYNFARIDELVRRQSGLTENGSDLHTS